MPISTDATRARALLLRLLKGGIPMTQQAVVTAAEECGVSHVLNEAMAGLAVAGFRRNGVWFLHMPGNVVGFFRPERAAPMNNRLQGIYSGPVVA